MIKDRFYEDIFIYCIYLFIYDICFIYSFIYMYSSMFRQFNVYNIVEEPGRMYLRGTPELSTFISKLLVFMWHSLAYKTSSLKF